MKRLLAYLSIIIGLGLVLNVNSYSEVYCVDTKIDERIKNFKPDYLTKENQFFYYSSYSTVCIGSYKKVKAKKYNYLKNLFNKEILKISSSDDKVESELGSQLILDDTDRNIEKLYRNILTSDKFLKKNKYLKLSKKKKISGKKNEIIVLAVYFNYEKELLRLTNNPEINDIDVRAWSWVSSNRNLDWKEIYGYAMGSLNTKAAAKCYKKALKLKLEGGECIIVDARKPTGSWDPPTINKNLLFHERETKTLKSGFKSQYLINKIAKKEITIEKQKKRILAEKKKKEKEKQLLTEKKKKEKEKQLLAEKKEVQKLERRKKILSLLNQSDLEKSQYTIDYTKKFIEKYPDEFDILEIAKKILAVKPISDGKINKLNLEKLKEYTSKSKKFVSYENKIIKNEMEKNIEIIENEIKLLTEKINFSKKYLSKNIDNIYANDLIQLISKSEKAVSELKSLDDIKENNSELTLLISKIDNLNDKIKVTKDLNLQLKEKLKKSLSTDLAPLLVSQIEKIEEVLNNIDINALEELIIETNKFIDKEINKLKVDLSKNNENKTKISNNEEKSETLSDQKKNKFVNISESEAKNPRHLNAIKNFNSKYSELIKEENLIKAAGNQNELTMSGKTLICEHKDGILGLFFIYNNELLSFEHIPGHPLYEPGYQDIVFFEDIYTNIRNPQFEYYADEDFISIGFGMKIDRKNGDFYSQNPLEDLEMKVKGQCKTFKGDLYKLFEYFKKLSKKSEENKQKKLKENKF